MPVRLGMLTPSSNTVLEPVTGRMVADLPEVTVHYSRFRVTEIALNAQALAQFDQAPILAAADLLADAKVDVIAWNGTSASWLGFERDEALCIAISNRTGIKARTSVLAFRDIFRATGVEKVGLVTPYTGDVQTKISATFAAEGFAVMAERHCGLSENFAFATVGDGDILPMLEAVATERPDAIAVVCTNMAAAHLVRAFEERTGVPVYDSVATTLWACLRATGTPVLPLGSWGHLFADGRLG